MSYKKLPCGQYYKLAQPDGYDFYTGNTINYREGIGGTVKVPTEQMSIVPKLCSPSVLHASKNPNDCFIGASIPCSMYIVKGKPVIKDPKKNGFRKLEVIQEIPKTEMNHVFGWNYTEAENPINPLHIKPPKITEEHKKQLTEWSSVADSVWASVYDSVLASVYNSVWGSVRDSVVDSVWNSVYNSVQASVWRSVWASVQSSIWDSVGAYIGSLFPNIEKWRYIKHKRGVYPFQSAVDLWRQGLIPSFDGETWRLHGGPNAKTLYKTKKEK